MPKSTTAFRQIRRLLPGCSGEELLDIVVLAQDMADQHQEKAEAAAARARAGDGAGGTSGGPDGMAAKRAAGHVELKWIGNCGPYAYLRFWEGGRLRSKYIGKVKQTGNKSSKGSI